LAGRCRHAIVIAPDWAGYSYDRWARGWIRKIIEDELGDTVEFAPHPALAQKSERPGGKGSRPFNADDPEALAD